MLSLLFALIFLISLPLILNTSLNTNKSPIEINITGNNNLIKSSVCNEIAREFFIERLIEYNEIYNDNLPALRLKVKM